MHVLTAAFALLLLPVPPPEPIPAGLRCLEAA